MITGASVRETTRYKLGTRLVRIKGASKKIKASYEQVLIPAYAWSYGIIMEERYSNRCRSYFRGIYTYHEQKLNESHIDEYGTEYGKLLVRGRRRNLPNSWDDVHVSAYDTDKSWKHNSKRRKQWIPK